MRLKGSALELEKGRPWGEKGRGLEERPEALAAGGGGACPFQPLSSLAGARGEARPCTALSRGLLIHCFLVGVWPSRFPESGAEAPPTGPSV